MGDLTWVEVVAQVGFPIAVTGYLLWERNTSLKNYTNIMQNLVTKVEVLVGQRRADD